MQSLIRNRVNDRLRTIVETINATSSKINGSRASLSFSLNEDIIRTRVLPSVIYKFQKWSGGSYSKPIANAADVHKKVQQQWNRIKAPELGDNLFCPLLCTLYIVRYN